MSTSTTNYGLIKPDTTDPILIGQLNDNADAIDAALKENADAIENKPDVDDIPAPSTAAPAMDGTAAAGTSTDYARADHVHPSDTSKQNALSSTQLAAVNSGIDSTKVEQIETNKNNILSLNDKINSTPKIVYKKGLLVSTGTTMASTGLEYTVPETSTGIYRFSAVASYNASQPDEIRLVNKADGKLFGVAARNTIASNVSVAVTGYVAVGVGITVEVQAKYLVGGNNYIWLIVEKIPK